MSAVGARDGRFCRPMLLGDLARIAVPRVGAELRARQLAAMRAENEALTAPRWDVSSTPESVFLEIRGER